MKMDRENHGHRPAESGLETSKAVTPASVVRSKGRGKKVQAFRLPSFVASAPHGECHDQIQTTSAAALGAIEASPIPRPGRPTVDAVLPDRSGPEPRPAAEG